MCDTITDTFSYHGTEVRSIEHGLWMLDHGPTRSSVNLEGGLVGTRNQYHGFWVRSLVNPSDLDLAMATLERIESVGGWHRGELCVFYTRSADEPQRVHWKDVEDSMFADFEMESVASGWFDDSNWPYEEIFTTKSKKFEAWRSSVNLADFSKVYWAILTS